LRRERARLLTLRQIDHRLRVPCGQVELSERYVRLRAQIEELHLRRSGRAPAAIAGQERLRAQLDRLRMLTRPGKLMSDRMSVVAWLRAFELRAALSRRAAHCRFQDCHLHSYRSESVTSQKIRNCKPVAGGLIAR